METNIYEKQKKEQFQVRCGVLTETLKISLILNCVAFSFDHTWGPIPVFAEDPHSRPWLRRKGDPCGRTEESAWSHVQPPPSTGFQFQRLDQSTVLRQSLRRYGQKLAALEVLPQGKKMTFCVPNPTPFHSWGSKFSIQKPIRERDFCPSVEAFLTSRKNSKP